jgi:hypothetical protein
VEVPLAFQLTAFEEGEPQFAFGSGLGTLFNASSGVFVRINGVVSLVNPGLSWFNETLQQYGMGASLGIRQRVFADNIRFRVSAEYVYMFENL